MPTRSSVTRPTAIVTLLAALTLPVHAFARRGAAQGSAAAATVAVTDDVVSSIKREELFKSADLDHAFTQLDRPEYRWDTRDAVIAHARMAAERAQGAMPRWFGRLPTTAVIVTPIPAVEESTSADRYQPGTIDGKRPGEYQINAARWIGQSKVDLEAVTFHETPRASPRGDSFPGAPGMPSAHQARRQFRLRRGVGTVRRAACRRDEAVLVGGRSPGHEAEPCLSPPALEVDTGIHAFGWQGSARYFS